MLVKNKVVKLVKEAPYKHLAPVLGFLIFNVHLGYPAPFLVGEFSTLRGLHCQGRSQKLIFQDFLDTRSRCMA